MTLPEDENDGLFEVDAIKSYTSQTGWGTVVTEEREDQDVIRAARTKRDGTVVATTNYAPVVGRKPGEDVLGRKSGHVVAAEARKQIVTAWKGMEDYDECPPDYGVFFEQYQGYTRHLVWTMGVAPREIDDVVSEIMTRFMERDSLGEFDRAWATRSATGKSVFRSYYSRFVVTYARGKHRNNVRHVKRFSLLCDAPLGDENGTTWIEQHDVDVEGIGVPHYEVEFSSLVESLRARVGDELMDVVSELVEETGKIKLSDLATKLGVSARKAREARDRLQAAAREVG